MRFLGEIEGRKKAERFVAYLLTNQIETHIEQPQEGTDRWEVWVREEDQLDAAVSELTTFQQNPDDPNYSSALGTAKQILEKKEEARREAIKNLKQTRSSRPGPAMMQGGRLPPLTLAVLIICIALGLLTNFGDRRSSMGRGISEELGFVSVEDFVKSNEDPAASLKRGEVWRAITPIFLHGSIIHLAMNMFMLVSFGRMVERWMGTPRFALLVLVCAIVPNLFQGLAPPWMHGTPFFVGFSGVLYGLFGYVWIRTSINPGHGITIPFPMVALFVGVIVLGLSGVIPGWNFADLCHLGGLLVGAAFGFAAEQGG